MKRSEMVSRLINMVYISTEADILITTAEAHLILTHLEMAGMAPPAIISMPDSYNRTEGRMGFEVHEWEEE
jgi:hypothetical protein